jgi:hypothetical protein
MLPQFAAVVSLQLFVKLSRMLLLLLLLLLQVQLAELLQDVAHACAGGAQPC